ncbi:MAG: hypothetical protein IKR12_02075 [Clostridia bacterium]|nr:hypothetical protein [Clostridia bacterium]
MLLENLGKVLSDPIYIVAIVFAAVGIALALIAKRVTMLVRKTKDVKADDKLLIMLKIAGLALILFAFVLLMIGGLSKLA